MSFFLEFLFLKITGGNTMVDPSRFPICSPWPSPWQRPGKSNTEKGAEGKGDKQGVAPRGGLPTPKVSPCKPCEAGQGLIDCFFVSERHG